LTFNHYDVERLSCVLIEKPWSRITEIQGLFPVELHFSEVLNLELIRCVEQGVFQKVRCAQRAINQASFDIIRLECVRYGVDRQDYILQFHGRPGSLFLRPGHETMAHEQNYNLCFSARSLAITEHYRSGWDRFFQGRHMELLDAFETVWPVPSWGMPDFGQGRDGLIEMPSGPLQTGN